MDACLKCDVREEADGRWSVARNGGVVLADFVSESAATAAATAMARDAGRQGYNATVEVHGKTGEPTRSWSYGERPSD